MPIEKHKLLTFICVFIVGFAVQQAMRFLFNTYDATMWANELGLFIARDPKQFDFNGAYGNPGTPVLELGTLFHALFGVTYYNAVLLSVSMLIALAVAACSIVCLVLKPDSLWWLVTTCTLLLNRMYLAATPPTAIVMPLIALIILMSWWYINQQKVLGTSYFVGWGAVTGIACACRYEIALLVSVPFSLLIAHRHGWKTMYPMIIGALFAFFVADPYLWTMPGRHLSDLVRRLTINYSQYPNIPLFADDFINVSWISLICAAWCLVLLRRRSLPRILPEASIILLLVISLALFIIVLFANWKSTRYLFPLAVVWEVILSLLVLEAVTNRTRVLGKGSLAISYSITAVFAVIQLVNYLDVYLILNR